MCTLGPGLTGFRGDEREASLALVRKHFAALRQPLAAAPLEPCSSSNSDFESEAHGAASSNALKLTRALERNSDPGYGGGLEPRIRRARL